MLLGKALGRRGGAKTGIPFTDERHLYGEPKTRFARLMGAGEPYRSLHEGVELGREQEPTSTVVWSGLSKWREVPLMWNVFPYHPHLAGDANTNRAPTPAEVEMGRDYVLRLMDIFGIGRGQVWCISLDAWREMFPGVSHRGNDHYVRMPTDRGEATCLRQLRELGERLAKK